MIRGLRQPHERVIGQQADGTIDLGPSHTYALDEIRDAHRAMESNTGAGKLVVVLDPT
ncbi:zinc-binding dehydrogenase [Mycobacterium sp. NPDC050441]|uniref:zinc-binding dehydrogenase n=1 Tax=Mycobacterium sp. NPDC050441 TaxID=3155403 RepID=UPI0033C38795